MQLGQPLIGTQWKRMQQDAGPAAPGLVVPDSAVEQVSVFRSHGIKLSHMMRRVCIALLVAVSLAGCSQDPQPEETMPPSNNAPGAIPAPPDVAAAPADAQVTASGLASKIITPGTGTTKPNAMSLVLVHYSGWTTNGELFDSSVMRGAPIDFRLNQVIPGWTEGVQLMVVGEKRRFWIPSKLAYDGMPGAPQGMLVFDVELLDFK